MEQTTSIATKIDELSSLVKSIGASTDEELQSQVQTLKELGEKIKNEIVSIPASTYKKSYRLLKNVHLYRSLMIQEITIDSKGNIIRYGDVLMKGHSLNDITSGAARSHSDSFTRVMLPSNIEFVEVFGGHNVFFALPKEGNYLYAWGVNTSGCAGNGTTDDITLPQKIDLTFRPKKIFCGKSQATGKQTTLILSEDGKVYGAGTNTSGELGIGNNINVSTFTQSPYLKDIQDISFASDGSIGYALAIDSKGALWGWGYNANGNLGLNNTDNITIPARLEFNEGVSKISTSVNNNTATSFILMNDGSIRGAGYNGECQLSQTNTAQSNVFIRLLKQNTQELINIREIYASAYRGTCFAIDNDNNLWSWGYGAQGFGDSRSGNTLMASVALESVDTLEHIETQHTRAFCTMKDSSAILAFGLNTDGALGIGTSTNTREFLNIPLPPNYKDFCLYYFANEANIALLNDEGVYSCGTKQDGNINLSTQTLQKQY